MEQRGFELMFRLYGPTEEFFDKVWQLPDIEKVAGGKEYGGSMQWL